MAIRTELSLRLQNTPGSLDRVCQYLLDERVNIVALSLEAGGTLRLVVDNPLRAAGTLEDKQYAVDQREVLLIQLPNDPGLSRQPPECSPTPVSTSTMSTGRRSRIMRWSRSSPASRTRNAPPWRPASETLRSSGPCLMRLYIGPMDAVLVEFDQDGKIKLDGEEWSEPTLQERRAVLYAAQNQLAELEELIDVLEQPPRSRDG